MKLLLRRDIPKLGLAGDTVEVSEGYARNYLLPHHLALTPTPQNLRRIEQDKRVAAEDRARRHEFLKREAERLNGHEITVAAAANEEGHLYGSVGPREVSRALRADGFAVQPDQVRMEEHIKQLDTRPVQVMLGEEISAEVKVWVVREKTAQDFENPEEAHERPDDGGPADESRPATSPSGPGSAG